MTPAPSPSMSIGNWGLLILLSLIWGASFLFGRIAVQEIAPLTLVFARVGLAALTLNIVLFFMTRYSGHSPRLWRDFAIMGLLNNIIPFGLIFTGQQEIGAGLAAIVNCMTPIWTVLIAHLTTTDERLQQRKVVGIAASFAGVAVLIGTAALTGLQASALAQLAVLGATLSYGIAGVFGRRFSRVPPIETARGQLTASTLIIAPFALVFGTFWSAPVPSATAIWSTIALAVVCTALAYILFFRILAAAGATNVSLVTFLIPPSAILLGIVFLGEEIALRHAIGLTLIVIGLLAIDGRLFRSR